MGPPMKSSLLRPLIHRAAPRGFLAMPGMRQMLRKCLLNESNKGNYCCSGHSSSQTCHVSPLSADWNLVVWNSPSPAPNACSSVFLSPCLVPFFLKNGLHSFGKGTETKCHRLGNFSNRDLFSQQFWKLETRYQGVSRHRFCWVPSLAYRWVSSAESSVLVSLCFCPDFVLRSSPAILDQAPPE